MAIQWDKVQWGKILVYVNLVLALGMGVWAFGLYTGRIDWSNKPAKGSEPAGELTKRLTRLKDVDTALTTAQTRERAAAENLRQLEQRRPRDLNFFGQEFAHVETGINAQKPLRIVEFKSGEMVLTPDGLPNMVVAPYKDKQGQPIQQSLNMLDNQLKQVQTDLLASIAEYQKLVEQDVQLTDRIIGPKGLRPLLYEEEEVKQARIKREIEDLKPLYINVLVETQLLDKRQKALQARIEELTKAAGRTARP
jgi:hypothetical protein